MINKYWRLLFYTAAGAISGLGSSEDEDKLEQELLEAPDFFVSIRGILFLVLIICSVIFEALVRIGMAFYKGEIPNLEGQDEDGEPIEPLYSVMLINRYSFKKWFDDTCVIECKPTFQEEYVFYKYYNKVGQISMNKKWRTYIPYDLQEQADEAKKNYLSYRLSGLVENPK